MDGSRFDSLVKDIGRVRSRRGVLGAIAAAAVGAVTFGRDRSDAAPAKGNNRCKDRGGSCAHDENCCFGVCCNKTCCDQGQVCNGAFCVVPPTATSVPTITPTPTPSVAGTCAAGADACDPVSGGNSPCNGTAGECQCYMRANGAGELCAEGSTGICQSCTSDAQCPSGLLCITYPPGLCCNTGATSACAAPCFA